MHEAVSSQRGIIDKYLGDGVLALFLEGSAEDQAVCALAAVTMLFRRISPWNDRGARLGRPTIRIIATLHRGSVLAGVFDDGNRAEFTVLGPAVNALSRMERRAKEANIDMLASKRFIRLLAPSALNSITTCPLARRAGDEELPDVCSVHINATPHTVDGHLRIRAAAEPLGSTDRMNP